MAEKNPAPGEGAPVWAKGAAADADLQALNVAFCAGRDVRPRPACDEALVTYDLCTNAAHAIMLGEQGILSADETRAILRALRTVRDDAARGISIVDPAREDVHMSIEARVAELAGPGMGGRLHTGRSRNDQVATDMRLWLRDRIAENAAELADLVRVLTEHARAHLRTPVPGMTHMQPAMITTWGHWVSMYVARASRDLTHLAAVLEECRACPLGAAASFGSSWPTNRERTAELLGFDRPTLNTTDSIQSRGELEGRFAFAAAQILAHLSGVAQDLILISTPPRQWVRLPDEFTTGSSIMPQKRNPDFAEVTRAKASVVAGMVQSFLGIQTAAPAGYNRDTQWTKYLVMDVEEEIRGAGTLYARLFERLRVFPDRMKAAADVGFLNATDVADFLARTRGLAFRDCYRVLGKATAACEEAGRLDRETINAELAGLEGAIEPLTADEMADLENPERLVKLRAQWGSPGPEAAERALGELSRDAEHAAGAIARHEQQWQEALGRLWEMTAERSG